MAPRNCGWELFAASLTLTLALIHLVEANSDVDALYALRQSLSDPNNVLQSWDPNSVDACTWNHVRCNQGKRVIDVTLGLNNLSGHLAPELGNLEQLQLLDLQKNSIQGTIPTSLGKLKSLVFLRLNNNRLTGPIPMELTTIPKLDTVDFSNNDLSGTIPRNGSFAHIPLRNFANNPRLKRPGLLGLASYDTNCT